jgi:cobalt/nickel transport system permease protein
VKMVCALLFLIAVATSRDLRTLALLGAELAMAIAIAALPLGAFLLRAAAPLPFAIAFAGAAALAGEPDRALLLLVRSALSIGAILLLAGTTPMARLLDALFWLRMPRALVEVIQFVYRYLFVLAEQAWRMRNAATSRGGRSSVVAATSTVRVLFAQAYRRAENIHRAMLARAYSGGALAPASTFHLSSPDLLLAAAAAGGIAAAFGVAV